MLRKVTRPDDLTVEQVERAIKLKAKAWQDNCYAVASMIVKAKLVKGRAAYGHYRGHLAPTGHWANRQGLPFVRHGWVVLEDGRILDPTRWSFEDAEPYLYIGKGDEYDEGGNLIREMLQRPAPIYDKQARKHFELKLKPDARRHVRKLLGWRGNKVTWEQLSWLACLSLRRLEPYAEDIFKFVIRCKEGALIPLDNRVMVLGE